MGIYSCAAVAWEKKRLRVRLPLGWEGIISGAQVWKESGGVWWGLPDPGEEQELEPSLDACLYRELSQLLGPSDSRPLSEHCMPPLTCDSMSCDAYPSRKASYDRLACLTMTIKSHEFPLSAQLVMTFCLKALLGLPKVFHVNNDLVNTYVTREHSSKQRESLDTLGTHSSGKPPGFILGGIYPELAWDCSPL